MFTDRQGNTLSGATADAVEPFDEAVLALNIYRGDPVALADCAIEIAPSFAMAHIFKAYLFAIAVEPEATAQARATVATARMLPLNDREKSHIAALDHLLANNWTDAALALDAHNMRHPHDLVGLQIGHLSDFFRANARNIRDRIARALPKWSADRPGYSIVLGMHAFGLEECGDYARAEAAGREAVAREPLDCWAHHAVAHVMEMQGRADEGIAWMRVREPHWSGDDNLFKIHNWWHKALFHLDLGQIKTVMDLYENRVRGDRSPLPVDLVDASALLWRVHLAGHDVGDRWVEVAECWRPHADGRLYPFNDWHAVMAYLGAGWGGEIDRLIDLYREDAPRRTRPRIWARTTGLPLIEGFVAFWRGDYSVAVERLYRARYIANSFGGSHAQRDIIDWTLTEAAIRGGMRQTAEALAHERLALKPHSPINRGFLNRAGQITARTGLAA